MPRFWAAQESGFVSIRSSRRRICGDAKDIIWHGPFATFEMAKDWMTDFANKWNCSLVLDDDPVVVWEAMGE